jgi:tripartite-type tricarboxylate transporter receptor subunit TctC
MKKLVISLFFLLLWNPSLHAQTTFYEGKTVRIVVGFSPGAAYDVWARLMAQHWSKFIPGNPSFVVQNMTGGGSLIAANHVYNVAKPDGLTLGFVAPGLYMEQLAGRKEAQHDWLKFTHIGSPESTARTLVTRLSRIFVKRLSHPSAALLGLAPQAISGPSCSQRPLDSS